MRILEMVTVIRQRINTDQIFNTWLLLSLTVLNALDYMTTDVLVSRGGYEVEVNPLLYSLMVYFDTTDVIIWAKVLGIFYIWGIFFYMLSVNHSSLYNQTFSLRNALLLMVSFYFVVVCWNMVLCLI